MSKNILIYLVIFVLFSCGNHTYEHGKRIYQAKCSNCHMEDGQGLGELIPPLANSDWLEQNQDKLACSITNGIKTTIIVNGTIYSDTMKGVKMTDIELNNVINYINNEWGNRFGEVTISETKDALLTCD